MTIGKKISPILEEIEMVLLEFEVNRAEKPEFTMEGFRAATKIFMSVMMDKIFELQNDDRMELTDRCNMAEQCGKDIRKLIHTYTGIDTYKLYD